MEAVSMVEAEAAEVFTAVAVVEEAPMAGGTGNLCSIAA
jgi:hypothetical protein